MEIRLKFQKMAEAAKEEHMNKRVSSKFSDGGDNGYNISPSVSTIPNQPVYYANSEMILKIIIVIISEPSLSSPIHDRENS
ncbi:10612_t:CDS:2 [Funneliformis geosporum]|uniref:10612_t:CDS:1 n=1 Tax=Funneliformis geosporum TaxID=1117311 RepID=A0A9W4X0I8_9GLOM|nr:10612_t:CDS:2 [Funneliformis geosporum]